MIVPFHDDASETTAGACDDKSTDSLLLRSALVERIPFYFHAAILGLTTLLGGSASRAADIVLRPGVPIVIDRQEQECVRLAAQDLARDLEKVLGARSPMIAPEEFEPSEGPAIVVATRRRAAAALRDDRLTGFESHSLRTQTWEGKPCVVLQGADDRGTMYAIYEFADRFLDVPPWWFWADWQAPRKAAVEVEQDCSILFPSPEVRYRVWFPNDRDMILKWPAYRANAEQALIETMLRLKLNMIDVGDLRREPKPSTGLQEARQAKRRGLAVTTTHTAPLGSDFKYWDEYRRTVRKQAAPPLRLDQVSALEDFWRHHVQVGVEEQLEMVWSIGFRGNGDVGFFELFPDAPADDAGRAKVISDMMGRQTAIVKQLTGQERPAMRCVLYNENSDYLAAGLLSLPDEPSLIVNFVNTRRNHVPPADVDRFAGVDRKFGYYFNLQFTSSGAHWAEAESPAKLAANLRYTTARTGRPLELAVINVGNLREFPLGASAHATMCWNLQSFDERSFLRSFAERYYGVDVAESAAELYRRYFAAFWQQRRPRRAEFEREFSFQDLRAARAGDAILNQLQAGKPVLDAFRKGRGPEYFCIVPADCQAADERAAIEQGAARAAAEFAQIAGDAAALEDRVSPAGRRLFRDHLVTASRFQAAVNGWLAEVAAVGDVSLSMHDREAHRLRALDRLTEIADCRERWDEVPFTDWHREEKIFNWAEMKRRTEKLRLVSTK